MRVGLITLGCDKNTVDNEYLAGVLEDRGCTVFFEKEIETGIVLDAVVVTTCGFIGDAKRQSVERMVELADRKRETGNPKHLYVAGCLAQRYASDLLKEIPEIDGIVGVGQFETLANLILGDSTQPCIAVIAPPQVDIYRFMRRKRSEHTPHAFLKIADGCNHHCTFCAIPRMKGAVRSVPPDILLEEARLLLKQGVKEFNLVAQDISVYGQDRWKDYRLSHFLRGLCALPGDFWVRCLYCYPGGVKNDLIEVIREEPKIVPYLDIPLQHLDPEILRRMKRPYREVNTFDLVKRLREAIPDLTLRTTMIVGFPGESSQAFKHLLEGIRKIRFDRLGVFQYSREEDTPAVKEARQVSKPTRERRWHTILETQAEISAELNHARIGQRTRVLVEGFDASRKQWFGRSPAEAPEVDGSIFLDTMGNIAPGTFVNAEISAAEIFDVIARPILQ
ncbi:MAG TPA: 30S ribosomal protein S12 methylthiotransferase RimO [Candidatus Hydrogenedentes bacterium]|nr:30S ribosomal protein S12 methylthiotransferase RimO [Candidatus Hydrogenedentota bacterium]